MTRRLAECKYGHDTRDPEARDQWHRCRACLHVPAAPLPFAPLERVKPRWEPTGWREDDGGYSAMGGLKGCLTSAQQRAWHRAQRAGVINVHPADDLATALGYHPSDIWPSEWWTV